MKLDAASGSRDMRFASLASARVLHGGAIDPFTGQEVPVGGARVRMLERSNGSTCTPLCRLARVSIDAARRR
jgi:hypothetical protein